MTHYTKEMQILFDALCFFLPSESLDLHYVLKYLCLDFPGHGDSTRKVLRAAEAVTRKVADSTRELNQGQAKHLHFSIYLSSGSWLSLDIEIDRPEVKPAILFELIARVSHFEIDVSE